MTDEERDRRQAEIYAARAEYEGLRAAYMKDLQGDSHFPVYSVAETLEPSTHESIQAEHEFRRGYEHGARDGIGYMWDLVKEHHFSFANAYNLLWLWYECALMDWAMAAKRENGNQTPPPHPKGNTMIGKKGIVHVEL